jgi:hypothetical protein
LHKFPVSSVTLLRSALGLNMLVTAHASPIAFWSLCPIPLP